MLEIMFQGEGGHGSVVAAKLLAQAAAKSGYHAQSFASYGALRRGGKVEGYVRISEEPLRLRCKMYSADLLVVMDEALLDESGAPIGLKKNGKLLLNTSKPKEAFPSFEDYEAYTVDAYQIAGEKGLVIPGGMTVINTTLLGALIGILKEIPVEKLVDAIKGGTPKPEKNAECALEGYEKITSSMAPGVDTAGTPILDIPVEEKRKRIPIFDSEKMARCNRCQICYISCPSLAITFDENPLIFHVNERFCTACGICIHECPRKAISWQGKEK